MNNVIFTEPVEKEKFIKYLAGKLNYEEIENYQQELYYRFCYIVLTIENIKNRKISWFDYANNNLSEYNDETMCGFLDPQIYYSTVEYVAIRVYKTTNKSKELEGQFPTSWFYESFEENYELESLAHFNIFKAQKKIQQIEYFNKQELIKKKYEQIQSSIESKLTQEELNFINFTSIEDFIIQNE